MKIFCIRCKHIGLGRIAIIDEGSEESQISEIEAVTQMTGPAVVIESICSWFWTHLVSIASNLTKLEQEMQRKQLRN